MHAQPSDAQPSDAQPGDQPDTPIQNHDKAFGSASSLFNTVQDFASVFYEYQRPTENSGVSEEAVLQEIWEQLKHQYKSTLEWNAYAGLVFSSAKFSGPIAGASFDLVAPLCRYIGADINSAGTVQKGAVFTVPYDARASACLPWGPFSFELGVFQQRDLRMALSNAPSFSHHRYDSDGVDMRLRGFRWFSPNWEAEVIPADIVFRSFSVPLDYGEGDRDTFQIDAAAFRFRHYGKGFLASERAYEAMKVSVNGLQEPSRTGRGMSTVVVSVAPFTFEGVPIGSGLYLDLDLAFVQGRIHEASQTEALARRFYFGADVQVHTGTPMQQFSVRLSRRLLSDSDFRLLSEQRLEFSGQFVRDNRRIGLSLFAAHNKRAVELPGPLPFVNAFSYGAEAQVDQHMTGNLPGAPPERTISKPGLARPLQASGYAS